MIQFKSKKKQEEKNNSTINLEEKIGACDLNEDDQVISELKEAVSKEERKISSLKGVNRRKLLDITRKLDFVINMINTKNISDTNLLSFAGRVGIPQEKIMEEQMLKWTLEIKAKTL